MAWWRLGVVGVVIGALLVARQLGVFEQLGSPRELADVLVAMGAWGYLTFVGAYTLLQPFGIPGTPFVFAASLIWPWPTAFALSMFGTLAASVVGFSFARFVARDWVAARIPARLQKYDRALERNALRTVVLLRTIFSMSQALHAFLGVSRVRFWTHFWGSLIGYIPVLLLLTYMTSSLFDESGRMRSSAWPILAGLAIAAVIAAALVWVWGRKRRAS